MKAFFKTFFASLLAVLVAGVILFGVLVGAAVSLFKPAKKATTSVALQDETILVLDLSQTLHEQRETATLAFAGGGGTAGLYELQAALRKAKEDDQIEALLLRTNGSSAGWATLQALRAAVLDFKKSGKRVYAYGEDISQRDYYVASAADSIFLNPAGDFELKGLASQLQFYKGALDKLGVKPEIFYAGKFKSATEPFRETKATEANRQQLTALLGDLWSEYLVAAAAHAQTDTATVAAWARAGSIQFPGDALQSRLVDGVAYWDEVESRLKARSGRDSNEKLRTIALSAYAPTIGSGAQRDDRIALLFAEGDITDGAQGEDYQIASEAFVKTIREVRDNKAVKAVVLRINSPGGSARASEIILRELQLLRRQKKLVVSMGDVAASGGYYIASGADSVFAQPNTITGSIGVFGMLFSTQGLLTDKLGVTFDVVKTAPYADMPTTTRDLTPDERARMQRGVDSTYALFKRRVVEGRHLAPELVDSVAQGRVWTGRAAQTIGLVDGLGDLGRAVQSAAALAGLKDYSLDTYPEPVDRIQRMIRQIQRVPGTRMQQAAAAAVGPAADQALKTLTGLQRMNGRVQAVLPFRWVVE